MKWKINLNNLPNNWKSVKLDEECEILMGQSPKGTSYNTEGIGVPLINGPVEFGGIKSFDKTVATKFTTEPTKICEIGDLILCVRGSTTGRMNIAAHNACIGRGVAAIRAKNHNQEWINYFLSCSQDLIYSLGSGSTFPNVSSSVLKNISIPVPPLEEQKRIVRILDESFEAIALAEANIKKNLANARKLFDSYLNKIFTERKNDWQEVGLDNVCSIESKLVDPREDDFIDLYHIGAGNIISKTGELINIQTAREEKLKSGKFVFDKGMVLYSKIRPYLMKCCRPNFVGLCSADIYPLLPNTKLITKDYLYHLLLTKNFTDYAISGSDRAGMPKVNRPHLFRYKFFLPPLQNQSKATEIIDQLSKETQKLEAIYQRKLEALAELKQSILQKAFTGQLTQGE